MPRTIDLTEQLGDACRAPKIQEMFDAAYRQRPIFDGARWLLHEPPNGFQPDPFLHISGAMALAAIDHREIGRRIATFLSPDLQFTPETRPQRVSISEGYGLISEIEELQYDAYLAKDAQALSIIIADKIIPYVASELGATHCCVIRPNVKAQQKRISLAKAYWAASAFPRGDMLKRVVDDKVLDAVMPLAHEMANWLYVFLTSSSRQVALSFQLMGGNVLFYRHGSWSFPYAAVAGIQGRFNANPSMDTSDEGARSGLWLPDGSPDGVYGYLRAVMQLVDALAFYAVNPANFVDGQKLDSAKQIQFISALGLFFSDVLSVHDTASMYSKVSFSLSALDKLANIATAMTGGKIGETAAFKACFSSTTAFGLRWIARQHASREPIGATILRVHARHILRVQKAVRDQVPTPFTELERLGWLRSYRNLKHGTFLGGDQFTKLFVDAKGLAPSELIHVVMAMIFGLAVDPSAFFRLFSGQAKTI